MSLYARLSPKMSRRQFKFESISAAGGFTFTTEIELHHLKRRHHPQLELPSKSGAVAVWNAFGRAQRHSTRCLCTIYQHTEERSIRGLEHKACLLGHVLHDLPGHRVAGNDTMQISLKRALIAVMIMTPTCITASCLPDEAGFVASFFVSPDLDTCACWNETTVVL